MIIAISTLFVVYVINGFVISDLTLNEVKKIFTQRNEAQVFNIITDLDKFIEKRISDFKSLITVPEIQTALQESNKEFAQVSNLEEFIAKRESEIEFTSGVPFIGAILDKELSDALKQLIEFYKNEYDYDVVEELILTNQHGASIALGVGTSDYRQDDEEWWQTAKKNGIFIGDLRYREEYQKYALGVAYAITDQDGNFIGVMRVLFSIDDILHEFINDAEVLKAVKKEVILLDNTGHAIYSNGIVYDQKSEPVEYFSKLTEDSGSLVDPDSHFITSYAKSIGYKDFGGLGWTVVEIQDQASFVNEFEELRNSIFITLVLGLIASVIIGIFGSFSITKPLAQIAQSARLLAKGDFDVKLQKSRINEVNVMVDSFNKMGDGLKKLVETEKKLAEANVKVKSERFTAMGELAASMAHDMKNPLATIRSTAEIVKRNAKGDDVEMKKVLERMDRAIYRMAHQIEDVLNFVRITPLEIKNVSILSILNSVIESLEIPKNITVDLPKNDLRIPCDERKIEIVFINLILNAIQAIGDKQGNIMIRISEQEKFAVIEVEDSGSGIPQEYFAKMFEPLVTSKQKGTGLGLATCKNIVEQHGGTITAKNNPTTFIVKLPLIS